MRRILYVVLLITMVFSFTACGNTSAEELPTQAPTWQEQYDLGIRYLSEGNYGEAILAFTAAIEIDPKQVDAYIGLADVYTAQGDIESALDVLAHGIDATGDIALENYRKTLEAKQDPWGSLTSEQQDMLQTLDTAVQNFNQSTVHRIMASDELEQLYMNSPLLWHRENDDDMTLSGLSVSPEDGVEYSIFTREYTANSGQVEIFEVYFDVFLNGNRYYSCSYQLISDDSNPNMGIYHRTPNAEDIADGPYKHLNWFIYGDTPNDWHGQSITGTARNGLKFGIETRTNLRPGAIHNGCVMVIEYDENGYLTNYGPEQETEDGRIRYECSMSDSSGSCNTELDPNQQFRCT